MGCEGSQTDGPHDCSYASHLRLDGDFTGFAMERRLRFGLDDFRGLVLAEVLAAGTQTV